MDDIVIRPAEPAELEAVAELRRQWILEGGRQSLIAREEFVRHFVDWAAENPGSHRAVRVRDPRVRPARLRRLAPAAAHPCLPRGHISVTRAEHVVPHPYGVLRRLD
ncbi:hypothetical protein ACIQPR_16240 [Streptomyces sp. NPDC091280]|uniref:hypothetical protein n=1 Tax=Streptomyces sp. NPDC091280 TaxID=3365984 RepID=UPI0038141B5A